MTIYFLMVDPYGNWWVREVTKDMHPGFNPLMVLPWGWTAVLLGGGV